MRQHVTALTALAFVALVMTTQTNSASPSIGPLTLIISPRAGGVTCEFEGKTVPSGQLLNTLGKSYDKAGPSVQLNIFVHQDVTLTSIFLVQATIGKVGFTNSKMFCFDRNRKAIWEVNFGIEQPFTLKP